MSTILFRCGVRTLVRAASALRPTHGPQRAEDASRRVSDLLRSRNSAELVGQDEILRPIGNRPSRKLHFTARRPITNRP